MDDIEFTEPPPPTPQRVAQRALILSAVTCRGIMEANERTSSQTPEIVERLQPWLKTLGLWEHLSDWEREVITAPFGTLGERDMINASWLSEGLVVLAWSLGKAPLPDCNIQCDPSKISNSLGFLRPSHMTALEAPMLLPENDLQEFNEFIYNVHWRLRDFSFNGRAYDFKSLAHKAWGTSLERHGLKLMNGDISIGGMPLLEADERSRRNFMSITRERHRASNWLIGYASENFHEVTTDT